MKVTKIPNKKKEDVLDILTSAMDEDYDEVLVIGFREGRYFITNSGITDGIKVVGALAMAQYEILHVGDN
jgi:hypothetical protein